MAEKHGNISLKELFEKAATLHDKIENSEEESNSNILQKDISFALELLTETTELVNAIGLFSTNEEIEEISTADLRYFLLPALSGDLLLRQISTDRISNVKIAKIYFIDFLKRCKDYGITDRDILLHSESNQHPLPGAEGLKQMAKSREEKIRRYKQQKQQESRLKELKKLSIKTADDEVQREYYMLLIKTWVNKSTEHLLSIKDELEILEHMEKMKMGKAEREEKKPERKPMKPILITKEAMKAKVFGAGYPSIPTMTQEEYLEKEIREGKVVLEYDTEQDAKATDQSKEVDDGKEENLEELYKARAMDDWKDGQQSSPSKESKMAGMSAVSAGAKGRLIAVIGDEDTCTGFLLGGIGEINAKRQKNFFVVGKETSVSEIEDKFREFINRKDIAILLINQNIAEEIRHVLDGYESAIPAVLEIPSKEHPYDPSKDSILRRAKGLFSAEDFK